MPSVDDAADALMAFALGLPEAWEDHPWGETALKVRKKVFVFLGRPEDGLSLGVKLRESHVEALELSYSKPMGYGLGRHGWVVFRFFPGDDVSTEDVLAWVEESYRAVAPKTLVRKLEA